MEATLIDIATKALEFLLRAFLISRESKRRVFDKIYQPLFDQLESINSNYSEIFEEILFDLQGIIANDSSEFNAAEIKSKLTRMRIDFAPLRVRIRSTAKSLATAEIPSAERNFVLAVLNYFPRGELIIGEEDAAIGGYVNSSSSLIIRKIYTDIENSEFSPRQIENLIRETLSNHAKRWQNVCASFATLQLEILV